MNNENQLLGLRVKTFRDSLRMTQGDFGEQCGLKQKTVSTMEAGKNRPLFENVIKICAAFPELNRDWLLFGTDPMINSNYRGRVQSPYERSGISSDGEEDKPTTKFRLAASESWEEIRTMYENVILELRADKVFLQEQLSKPSVA